MAQIPYRANLSSAVFPLCLAKAGRTVIVPGVDQNYDRRVDPSGEQKDAGIPQAMYLENVIPTANGYQSLGFKPTTAGDFPLSGSTAAIIMKVVFPITSSLLQEAVIVFRQNGTVTSRTPLTSWGAVTFSGTAPTISTSLIHSWALVKGVCYIQLGNNLYTFDGTTLTNVTASITGLTFTNVAGIVGAFNYLIVATYDKIYWSSTTTTLDFVPSLVSGAGSQELGANGTWVNFLKPHPSGFFVYTLANAIFAQYTGNRAYPWKFREIADSGSFENKYRIIEDTTNSDVHYGVTLSGQLQVIGPEKASVIGPEVSDYLERNVVYDTYDSTTNVFTSTKDTNLTQNGIFETTIAYCSDRYIVVSYSNSQSSSSVIPVYRFAFIYDTLLKRYGRIVFNHTIIVEFAATGELLFINGITGTVRKLYFDIYDQDLTNATAELRYQHSGVLVLGKFQLLRNEFITLEELTIESSQDTGLLPANSQIFSVAVLPSLKGKQFDTAVVPYYRSDESEETLQVYSCHITAKNLAIAVKGAFDINTLQLEMVSGGDW